MPVPDPAPGSFGVEALKAFWGLAKPNPTVRQPEPIAFLAGYAAGRIDGYEEAVRDLTPDPSIPVVTPVCWD